MFAGIIHLDFFDPASLADHDELIVPLKRTQRQLARVEDGEVVPPFPLRQRLWTARRRLHDRELSHDQQHALLGECVIQDLAAKLNLAIRVD